jgi:PAS domain-containing protein
LAIVKNVHLGLIALQEGQTNGATTLRVVEVNPAAAQIIGMRSEELLGRALAECPKLPETGIENHCRQVIRSGKPKVLGEIRYGEEGARTGVYVVTVFPLPNSCVGVAFDNVTERKPVEAVLGWLASFPDRNPNPVIETNSEGIISYVNAAALKAFPDLQVAGAEHAALKGLPQVIAELSSIGKDYLEREVAVGALIYEQQISFIPEANRVRIYCLEITERKRADAALRASEKALGQLSSRLLQLQDEERRRMARELHDSTGQILTALTMKLGALRRSVGALDLKTSKALSESLALAEQCSREVRLFLTCYTHRCWMKRAWLLPWGGTWRVSRGEAESTSNWMSRSNSAGSRKSWKRPCFASCRKVSPIFTGTPRVGGRPFASFGMQPRSGWRSKTKAGEWMREPWRK